MPKIIETNDAELATIHAALRFYQEKGQGDPANRSDAIDAIAISGPDGGEVVSLDANGIDELCDRINLEPGNAGPVLHMMAGFTRYDESTCDPENYETLVDAMQTANWCILHSRLALGLPDESDEERQRREAREADKAQERAGT